MKLFKISSKLLLFLGIPIILIASSWMLMMPAQVLAAAPAAPCPVHDFFGLVPWYGYFDHAALTRDSNNRCGVNLSFVNGYGSPNGDGSPNQSGINSIWLIALAIFEDLLRVAGVLAVGFIIYGGIRYITSQGEPENTRAARSTIINALIGAAIAMVAAVTVSFIGTKLGAG